MWNCFGNSGPASNKNGRQQTDTQAATATGMKLQAARLPFEQQQFDGEHDGGNRRTEDRRHAGSGAGDKQRLALSRTQVKALGKQRADRPASHDDGALSAERATGSDRDCRGNRLQDRHFRRHPATTDQDRLDRLGDTVAADLLRAKTRHQPDDETAGNRDDDHPDRARRRRQRDGMDTEAAEPDEVGHQ
jgi:hypothetical protein